MLIRTAFLIGERDDNTNRRGRVEMAWRCLLEDSVKDVRRMKRKDLALEKFDEF